MTIAYHLISHFNPFCLKKAKLKPDVLQPFSFLQDLDTIRFIQDKYPQLSFMFVCNKIDTSAEAKQFDCDGDSDESDSEDEETRSREKQRTVFSELQNNGLIDDNDSYETFGCFYGISAHDVREERLNKKGGKATKAFARFEEGLLAILDETIKLQAKQVVNKLILLQMALVQAMKRTRQTLAGTLFGNSLDYDAAKSIGKSLHSALMSAVADKNRLLEMSVNCSLINLEERFVLFAESYQYREIQSALTAPVDARAYYLLLVENSENEEKPEFSLQNEDAPFLQFLVGMKAVILDRTFNVLKRVVEEFLKGITDHVQIHSRRICNPLIEYAYKVAYGSGLPKAESSATPQTDVGGLNIIKRTVIVAMRKIVKRLLMEGVLCVLTEWRSPSDTQLKLEDRQSRRKIIEMLFSNLNGKAIPECIFSACTEILEVMHAAFFKVIDDLSQVNDLALTKTSKQMEEMATLYVPTVRHLIVKALALRFLLTKGPLLLGPVLKVTKHGQLHECAGWADELTSGACVVKVIKEEEVEAEVWAQTSVDLFNTM